MSDSVRRIVADPQPATLPVDQETTPDGEPDRLANPDALSALYLAARAEVRAGTLSIDAAAERVRRAYAIDADGVRWGIGTDGRWWMLEPMGATVTGADPAMFAYVPTAPAWTPPSRARPDTIPAQHLVLAVLAMLLCWPAGIVAVWNAANVATSVLAGDPAQAAARSRRAALWGWIGVAVGGLLAVGVAVAAVTFISALSRLAPLQ